MLGGGFPPQTGIKQAKSQWMTARRQRAKPQPPNEWRRWQSASTWDEYRTYISIYFPENQALRGGFLSESDSISAQRPWLASDSSLSLRSLAGMLLQNISQKVTDRFLYHMRTQAGLGPSRWPFARWTRFSPPSRSAWTPARPLWRAFKSLKLLAEALGPRAEPLLQAARLIEAP